MDTIPFSTPFLLIDEHVIEANITRLSAYAVVHRLGVRPHAKTHKSLDMARRQIRSGAAGLTVAKAGEAEIMAKATNDLLLAYPPVDAARARVVAQLAQAHQVSVAVDGHRAIESTTSATKATASRVGVLVDLDVGMGRTGVPTPRDALELAQAIDRQPSLRLQGLFLYPGHIWARAESQPALLAAIDDQLRETIHLWSRSGLACPIVSGGSTPTLYQSHHLTAMNEVRPGTYLYNDMNTVRGGFCNLHDCAARIVCTVISDAVKGKVVVDAGTKALAADRNVPFPDSGHGHVVEYPDAVIVRLSEEHGELDVRRCDRTPAVGERVSIIPNHICPCVNLQETAILAQQDGDFRSLPINARGRLS